MMRRAATSAAALGLLFLGGCQVKPVLPRLVETVAVLPFDSESNDINAPDVMQRLVYLALKPSGYRVLDITEVNEKLAAKGIREGGQLNAADPVKVAQDLGVQAIIFGNVESFNYTNIGFYLERKVRLELKMVDGNTGQTIWENTATAATRQVNIDKDQAGKAFTKGLADQLADKLFSTPLEEEAKLATTKTLRTLPGFAFAGFARDEATPSTAKSATKGIIKDVIRSR